MNKVIKYVNPPEVCDNCHCDFGRTMYDCKTVYGSWANLCTECFNVLGLGIGPGLGQQYIKEDSGDWVKYAG